MRLSSDISTRWSMVFCHQIVLKPCQWTSMILKNAPGQKKATRTTNGIISIHRITSIWHVFFGWQMRGWQRERETKNKKPIVERQRLSTPIIDFPSEACSRICIKDLYQHRARSTSDTHHKKKSNASLFLFYRPNEVNRSTNNRRERTHSAG